MTSDKITKVIVTGGRDYFDFEVVKKVLDGFPHLSTIIQGGADGADKCARKYADYAGKLRVTYQADWRNQGKSAGPIRNTKMLKDNPTALVVAFPGGRGTKNCVETATKLNMPVLVVEVHNEQIYVTAINEEIEMRILE